MIPSAVGAALYRLSCGNLDTHMSHSYANNYVHAVYSTKDRRDLIPPEFEKRLYSFMAAIADGHKIPLVAAGGMANHTHLLFLLPATISLASAINIFKTNSSRFLHERGLGFQWQNGMTFDEDFLELLKMAGVSYDPKHVFG